MNRTAPLEHFQETTGNLSHALGVRLAVMLQAGHKRFSDRRAQRAIGHLTPEQMRDIGIEPRPDGRLPVSASLMTRLMSMS